jgi:hypothetical protein
MDNIEYTRRIQTKQQHNTICVGHQYIHSTKFVLNACDLIKQKQLDC